MYCCFPSNFTYLIGISERLPCAMHTVWKRMSGRWAACCIQCWWVALPSTHTEFETHSIASSSPSSPSLNSSRPTQKTSSQVYSRRTQPKEFALIVSAKASSVTHLTLKLFILYSIREWDHRKRL